MKVIVISAEGSEPRERPTMEGLFKEGLERYHVRKPAWSEAQLESWLRALPGDWLPRIVVHQHHGLVARLGLGGAHDRDIPHSDPALAAGRSCHDLESIRIFRTKYQYLIYGPVFNSLSKQGYGPGGEFSWEALEEVLKHGPVPRARVFAVGGIVAESVWPCHEHGFGGIALHGRVWKSSRPVLGFTEVRDIALEVDKASSPRASTLPRLMCLTQDGAALGHAEQAREMCEAGARFIQFRMKGAEYSRWLAEARTAAAVCRAHGATFIVNDSVDIALEVDADGVHLGRSDEKWSQARRRLGPRRIIGGTVNNREDARRAVESKCLDYVGIGPLRFTATKRNLAPVLGTEGIREIMPELGGLASWAIGGVELDDIPSLRASHCAARVAVSSALFRNGTIGENVRRFLQVLDQPAVQEEIPIHS